MFNSIQPILGQHKLSVLKFALGFITKELHCLLSLRKLHSGLICVTVCDKN